MVVVALGCMGVAALCRCGALRDGARGQGAREKARSSSEALVQCPPAALEGIDVFDGQGTIDWPRVAGAGVAFAFIKATQGTYDTQSTFASNWAGAGAAGVARGAYHFFDPTEDGAAQADHFLSVLAAAGAIDAELPPMLDVECPDGDADCLGTGASGAATAASIAAGTWAFLGAVAQATGRAPLVYTFLTYFESNGVDAAGLDAFPLWLAYPTGEGCFPVPPPWTEAAGWQYSWTGQVPGIAGDVDRDRWMVGPAVSLPVETPDTSSASFTSSSSASSSSSPSLVSSTSWVAVSSSPSPEAGGRFVDAAESDAFSRVGLGPSGCAIGGPPSSPAPDTPGPPPSVAGLMLACSVVARWRTRLPGRSGAC
jgi:lysozyme